MIKVLFKKFKLLYISIIFFIILYSISQLLILTVYNNINLVKNIGDIFKLSMIFFLSWLIKNVIRYFISIIGIKTDMKAKEFFSDKFIDRLFYENYFDLESNGSEYLNTLFNRDIERVSSFTSKIFIKFLMGFILFVVSFIYALYLSYILTIVILSLSLLSVFITKYFEIHVEEVEENNMTLFEKISKLIISLKTNKIVISIENIGDFLKSLINKDWEELKNANEKQIKLHIKVESLNFGIGMIANTLWIVLALYLVYINKLTIGSFIVFMALSETFNWPFFEYPFIKIQYIQNKKSLNRLEDYKRIDLIEDKNIVLEKLEIKDLTFAYDNKKIKYPNMCFNRGDWISIIGESGSGKTTLIKTLLGMYEKENGKISLNGKDLIRLYDEIRVGYVPQNSNIYFKESETFNFTLKDECKIDSTSSSIFDININENNKYSGGEQKRIGLYRAIYYNPEILILDEYSAGLDDLNLSKSLELLKGLSKTIIFITHDKRILQMCDREYRVYG